VLLSLETQMAYNPKSITNKSVHCTLSKMVVSWFVFLKFVQHPISAVDCCTFAHSNSILIMLDTRRERFPAMLVGNPLCKIHLYCSVLIREAFGQGM